MRLQTVRHNKTIFRFKAAHLTALLVLVAGLLLSASPLLAEPAHPPRSCDIAGTWYGGGGAAYLGVIHPAAKPGHYTMSFQGMYKAFKLNTTFEGVLVKRGNRYVGSGVALVTQNDAFLGPPPIFAMPDFWVGWFVFKQVDCNTIEDEIPFFGQYNADNIWKFEAPAGLTWVKPGKVPLIDPPDLDLLNVLNSGDPIKETYHRLLNTVNRDLLHKDAEAH